LGSQNDILWHVADSALSLLVESAMMGFLVMLDEGKGDDINEFKRDFFLRTHAFPKALSKYLRDLI